MILQCFHLSYMELFKDVHFTIEENGLYLLYGKSGCGKTTFLHILSSLITNYEGEILLDHQSLSKKQNAHLLSNIGIMFQNECMIKQYTLLDHLKMVESNQQKIDGILNRLDLLDKKNTKIADLSLGQKQRATLAFIALKRPPIILLDEPTSQLDQMHLTSCKELIVEMAKESIVIIASHQSEQYIDAIDGLLEIKDQKMIFDRLRHSYCFSRKKVNLTNLKRRSILLSFLHLKTRTLACFKLICSFSMIFILLLFLFEITFSFDHFLKDYQHRYPDLYTLYIDEIEEEKLFQFNYDYLTKQKHLLDEYEVYLISQDVKLKEGKMPGKNEVIISEDLKEMKNLSSTNFKVVGIIDNPFIKNSCYVSKEDYELLEEDQGEVMVFHDLDTLKKVQKEIEGTLLTRTYNDYQSFLENYQSVISLFLLFLYCFSGYCFVSLTILLFLQLKSYLSYDLHEMVFLKCEGNRPYKIMLFYMIEIVSYSILSFILSLAGFLMFLTPFQKYFERNFFPLEFLNIFNLFQYHHDLMFFVMVGVLMVIILFIYLNISYVFTLSISRFVKENEGC